MSSETGVERRTRAAVAARRLTGRLRGKLLLPGADGYEPARRVFNAMIDRHPAVVIRCDTSEDVLAGVDFARAQHLPVTVKAGGHGVAGRAVCDGGAMLDLSAMKIVAVDRGQRTAVVGPGVTLRDLDRETQSFGLATPTGVVSMTGLSGLALGGGLGWLNGLYGLTCDNLMAADVVTASGARVVASDDENPELLWGLRGGGGNFGVVTSFQFRLHPVGTVLGGAVTYPARKARAALRLYHEFASACPDELSTALSLSRPGGGEAAVSIAVCYPAQPEKADKLLQPLLSLGPEANGIQPMSYQTLQSAADEGFPAGQHHYWKSGYVTDIDDALIDVFLDHITRMPSPVSGIGLQQLHGVAGRVDPSATAFPHRGDRYDCLILSQWPDPADSEHNIAWTNELFDALQPFLGSGVYVNNLGDEGDQRTRQAYGHNYDRLAALKTQYDPTNLFRHNQNIKPLSATPNVRHRLHPPADSR
ncbi:MAG TPA: FAD-binding oxidoreductase [Solirubrobacteraceae bacterium]|nr:FAD-binding oxidoreductase [Solirubrobacteraceae bacterium]